VLTGVAMLTPEYNGFAWAFALAGATAVTGTASVGWRVNQRRRVLAAATNLISHQLKAPIVIEKARWRGRPVGQVVEVSLRYTELAALGYGELLPAQLTQACSKAFSRPFRTVNQTPAKSRIKLAAATTQPAADLTESEKQQQRVRGVVSETFGVDAIVVDLATDQDDSITRFTVHYRTAAAKVTVAAVRRRITNAVTDRLDGRWKADFSLQNDTVTFTRRPPLPSYVPRDATAVPARDDPAFNLIPQAIDEDGKVMAWDVAGVQAHILKAGKTRTGKTVTLIGDALEAARRQFRVFVLDPKRIEFLGLRGWPNVQLVATTVPEQVALVHLMWLEMQDRYRRIEEEGVRETDFDPILFIIDEYRQLYANAGAWWSSIKVSGMPTECPVFEEIGSLLRMAAACRIHIDLATQRPDAAFLKGEVRDNFSARAATGRLSPDGAEMMFDSVHIGVTIPQNVRGRGTMIGTDDRPREVQFLYTPDPRKARSPEDFALLEALRPSTATWPRLAIELPELAEFSDELAEGKKTSFEWEQVLRGRLVPWEADLEHPEPDFRTAGEPDCGPVDDSLDRQGVATNDEYERPTVTHAGAVDVGDLITIDDGGTWVCVSDVGELDDGHVQLGWRDDDDRVGEVITSAEEIVDVRKPTTDE
jgi:S-DNA-T family DNA segregation ATPase FtsK/SpoIIIE